MGRAVREGAGPAAQNRTRLSSPVRIGGRRSRGPNTPCPCDDSDLRTSVAAFAGATRGSGSGEYDCIVVGAGSAGCVLAARLSEDPTVRVALLESGGRDRRPEIRIPAAFPKLFRTAYDWDFGTVAQPAPGGRELYWPRGHTLGGCSSINAMMWVRGHRDDYDAWAP